MRTPEVETALGYVRNGVEGSCLVDYRHKATISWTIDILAAEIERLETLLCESTALVIPLASQGATWKQRAETAETRYAASQDALTEVMGELTEARARVAELEAQNARLREALAGIVQIAAESNDYIARGRAERMELIARKALAGTEEAK